MESVDRTAMVTALYPTLLARCCTPREGTGAESASVSVDVAALPPESLANVIASSAEGYAFPSNLDNVAPAFNFEHRSQASIMAKCLIERTDLGTFLEVVREYNTMRV
jgi:hypothetical protein